MFNILHVFPGGGVGVAPTYCPSWHTYICTLHMVLLFRNHFGSSQLSVTVAAPRPAPRNFLGMVERINAGNRPIAGASLIFKPSSAAHRSLGSSWAKAALLARRYQYSLRDRAALCSAACLGCTQVRPP